MGTIGHLSPQAQRIKRLENLLAQAADHISMENEVIGSGSRYDELEDFIAEIAKELNHGKTA